MKLLTQTFGCAKKNIFIVIIVCSLCTRAAPQLWGRRGQREWQPCVQNTAHCAKDKLEEFFFLFFRNRPAHSLRLAACLWRALIHHKLRPPLKYSVEQMVLKHDCSPPPPSHTCHVEPGEQYTHILRNSRYKHEKGDKPKSSHTVCSKCCRKCWHKWKTGL